MQYFCFDTLPKLKVRKAFIFRPQDVNYCNSVFFYTGGWISDLINTGFVLSDNPVACILFITTYTDIVQNTDNLSNRRCNLQRALLVTRPTNSLVSCRKAEKEGHSIFRSCYAPRPLYVNHSAQIMIFVPISNTIR